jgi:hypothetical protein
MKALAVPTLKWFLSTALLGDPSWSTSLLLFLSSLSLKKRSRLMLEDTITIYTGNDKYPDRKRFLILTVGSDLL